VDENAIDDGLAVGVGRFPDEVVIIPADVAEQRLEVFLGSQVL
jgi:hypothetical protein